MIEKRKWRWQKRLKRGKMNMNGSREWSSVNKKATEERLSNKNHNYNEEEIKRKKSIIIIMIWKYRRKYLCWC